MHEAQRFREHHRGGRGKKLDRPPREGHVSRKFYFRLALALGCTVKELLQRCDAAELAEWQAYYIHEPWGSSWRQTATIASAIAWSAGAKDVDERNFMPCYYERPMEQADIQKELLKLGGLFQPTEGGDG